MPVYATATKLHVPGVPPTNVAVIVVTPAAALKQYATKNLDGETKTLLTGQTQTPEALSVKVAVEVPPPLVNPKTTIREPVGGDIDIVLPLAVLAPEVLKV
jgi:hypothetical protein